MPSAVGLITAPCKSAVFPLLEHESSVYVHTKWNWKSADMFTLIPIKPLLTLQMTSCPRTRGCSGSSWRTTSWRIKLSWDSCTMASIWRLLVANVWGSSSIVQYVRSTPLFLPRNDECHARLHAFQPHCLIDFGLNWCFYGRLCALRTPVWSGAVKREAMERFTSQKLCWNQQKNPCLRFWGRTEDLSKSTSILLNCSSSWMFSSHVQMQSPVFIFCCLCCRIFLSLMEAADLTDLLKQEGDFTLFAPSDKAFAGLTEIDLNLLKSRCSFFS